MALFIVVEREGLDPLVVGVTPSPTAQKFVDDTQAKLDLVRGTPAYDEIVQRLERFLLAHPNGVH